MNQNTSESRAARRQNREQTVRVVPARPEMPQYHYNRILHDFMRTFLGMNTILVVAMTLGLSRVPLPESMRTSLANARRWHDENIEEFEERYAQRESETEVYASLCGQYELMRMIPSVLDTIELMTNAATANGVQALLDGMAQTRRVGRLALKYGQQWQDTSLYMCKILLLCVFKFSLGMDVELPASMGSTYERILYHIVFLRYSLLQHATMYMPTIEQLIVTFVTKVDGIILNDWAPPRPRTIRELKQFWECIQEAMTTGRIQVTGM